MANNVKKEVMLYAGVAFILLSVLFGMNIMSFIFGSLGPDAAGFTKTAGSIANETGAALNDTNGYELDAVSTYPGFANPVILELYNNTGGAVPTTLYSVSASGLLTNISTNATYTGTTDLNVSYSFDYDAGARLTSSKIQNASLYSIETYSNASHTQFNIVSIAIILVVLISLFMLFWKSDFMKGGSNRSGGNFQ